MKKNEDYGLVLSTKESEDKKSARIVGTNYFQLVDFELNHPNNELERFLITDEIFEDGLKKDTLIHTIKRIYKAKLQCLWLLERTFSQKNINIDEL